MSGEKLAEGILATTRNFRNEDELRQIAEDLRVSGEAYRKKIAGKQAVIDEEVKRGSAR